MQNEYINWYTDPDLLNAVNLCLNALSKSGISAERAAYVPGCLAKAIRCSNLMVLRESAFKQTPISVTKDERGWSDVTPGDLAYIDQLELL